MRGNASNLPPCGRVQHASQHLRVHTQLLTLDNTTQHNTTQQSIQTRKHIQVKYLSESKRGGPQQTDIILTKFIASAVPTICIAKPKLLHNFVTPPVPGAPTWTMFLPIAESTRVPSSKTAASPPTMKVRVPAVAPATPPDTCKTQSYDFQCSIAYIHHKI